MAKLVSKGMQYHRKKNTKNAQEISGSQKSKDEKRKGAKTNAS